MRKFIQLLLEGVALGIVLLHRKKIEIYTSLIAWYAVRGLIAAFECKNQITDSKHSYKKRK